MRRVINVTTRKENNKIKFTNNNYDQNSLSIFLKQLITQSKWRQTKTILRKNKTCTSLEKKIWYFSSMRLDNKSTKKIKEKFKKTLPFFGKN